MAVALTTSGTTTLVLATPTSVVSAQAAPSIGGLFQFFVDLTNLVNGETFTLTVQKALKSGGTVRTLTKRVVLNAPTEAGLYSDPIPVISGETFTIILQQDNGTGRAYDWELLQLDALTNVNVTQWVGVAPNALVSGKVDSTLAVRGGTAQAGAAGSITLDAGASATDNLYRGQKLMIVSGTGVSQCRLITGYTGASKVATVTPNWVTNPDNTSVFIVAAWAASDVATWLTGAIPAVTVTGVPKVDLADWLGVAPNALVSGKVDGTLAVRGFTAQAGAAGTITLDAGASATDNLYRGLKVQIVSGTGAGQARLVTSYTGASKVATVAPNWVTNPDATSVCIAASWAGVDVETWLLGTIPAVNVTGVPKVDVFDWLGVGAPANTGDAFARVGAPAGASASVDIAAIKVDTAAIKVKTDALTTSGIKKNTPLAAFEFPIYSATDHVTPLTGVSPLIQRSIDGGAYGNSTSTPAVEIGATGRYKIDLSAADLNGNVVEFKATAVGADPMDWTIVTVS